MFGWWAGLFLLDKRLLTVVAALAAHYGLTVFQVVAAGRGDLPTLTGMGITALALGGLPVVAWLVGAAIGRTTRLAVSSAAEAERLRTAEATARQLHRDRRERFAGLLDDVGPLLAGLADGTHDPDHPAVRRACLVEAARVRRLLAESDVSDDRLMHEMTACSDTAVRRGIAVELAVRGRAHRCRPLSGGPSRTRSCTR